jgi:hypothetical protein
MADHSLRPGALTCKAALQVQKLKEKQVADAQKRDAELRSYKNLLDEDAMTSNKDIASKYATAEEAEDDFM